MEVPVGVDIITTSVKGWNRYIKPLIDSVEKWEGVTSNIIIVDAGGFYPNTYKDTTIIHTPILNCSEAQNVGLAHSTAEWFLVLDCDVLCEGKFIDIILELEHGVYGNVMHKANHKLFTGPSHWLDGWIYAFPREVYEKIGGFDENFQGSGFEDADFCWRAEEAGYEVLQTVVLPFKHLFTGQKREISDGYKKVRLGNVEYLKNKWKLK